jgi:hypothetical protein
MNQQQLRRLSYQTLSLAVAAPFRVGEVTTIAETNQNYICQSSIAEVVLTNGLYLKKVSASEIEAILIELNKKWELPQERTQTPLKTQYILNVDRDASYTDQGWVGDSNTSEVLDPVTGLDVFRYEDETSSTPLFYHTLTASDWVKLKDFGGQWKATVSIPPDADISATCHMWGAYSATNNPWGNGTSGGHLLQLKRDADDNTMVKISFGAEESPWFTVASAGTFAEILITMEPSTTEADFKFNTAVVGDLGTFIRTTGKYTHSNTTAWDKFQFSSGTGGGTGRVLYIRKVDLQLFTDDTFHYITRDEFNSGSKFLIPFETRDHYFGLPPNEVEVGSTYLIHADSKGLVTVGRGNGDIDNVIVGSGVEKVYNNTPSGNEYLITCVAPHVFSVSRDVLGVTSNLFDQNETVVAQAISEQLIVQKQLHVVDAEEGSPITTTVETFNDYPVNSSFVFNDTDLDILVSPFPTEAGDRIIAEPRTYAGNGVLTVVADSGFGGDGIGNYARFEEDNTVIYGYDLVGIPSGEKYFLHFEATNTNGTQTLIVSNNGGTDTPVSLSRNLWEPFVYEITSTGGVDTFSFRNPNASTANCLKNFYVEIEEIINTTKIDGAILAMYSYDKGFVPPITNPQLIKDSGNNVNGMMAVNVLDKRVGQFFNGDFERYTVEDETNQNRLLFLSEDARIDGRIDDLRTKNGVGAINTGGTDIPSNRLNLITTNGKYRADNTNTDMPTGWTQCIVDHSNFGGSVMVQIATKGDTATQLEIQARKRYGTGSEQWTPWNPIVGGRQPQLVGYAVVRPASLSSVGSETEYAYEPTVGSSSEVERFGINLYKTPSAGSVRIHIVQAELPIGDGLYNPILNNYTVKINSDACLAQGNIISNWSTSSFSAGGNTYYIAHAGWNGSALARMDYTQNINSILRVEVWRNY